MPVSLIHSGNNSLAGFSMKEVILFCASVFNIPNSVASLSPTGMVAMVISAPCVAWLSIMAAKSI